MPTTSLARAAALAFGLALTACQSPIASMRNLEELHPPEMTVGGRGLQRFEGDAYPETITHRGRWQRFKDRVKFLFTWSEPSRVERPILEPVKFALYQVQVLWEDGLDLAPIERDWACLVLADVARRSPSRAVRASSLNTLQRLLYDSSDDFRFVPADGPDDDLTAITEPVESLVRSTPDAAAANAEADPQRWIDVAAALATARPSTGSLSDKLARLAVLASRQVPDGEVHHAFRVATHALVLRTSFLTALEEMVELPDRDPVGAVQSEAMRLAAQLDAVAASRVWGRPELAFHSRESQVALLHALADAQPDPRQLDPSFRSRLAMDVESSHAAISHWARRAIVQLLDLPPADATDAEVVLSRWNALGQLTQDESSS